MKYLEIRTSKCGRLWSEGYWKNLIDSLSCGGAKKDPNLLYHDLAPALSGLIESRGTRFYPRKDTLLADSDDSALRMINVYRVQAGEESVKLGEAPMLTAIASWVTIPFPFFGTIGNSQYEAQSKLNRETLVRDHSKVFLASDDSRCLGLAFQQTTRRRDRDLDNLADALIPVFNSHIRQLNKLCLVKLDSVTSDREFLRITTCEQDLAFHLSVDGEA